MRTGLLAVGAAMALVGAGVMIAVTMPVGTSQESKTDRSWVLPVDPDNWATYNVPAAAEMHAAISFSWNTSRAAEVDWYVAGPCPTDPASWCLHGVLKSWSGSTSGNWTTTGPTSSGYCVQVVNENGSESVSFSGEFVESYPAPSHHLPMLPLAFGIGGGALLIGMGGLAIYLGVFLPPGVYRSSPEGSPGDDPDEPYDDRTERPLDGGRNGPPGAH